MTLPHSAVLFLRCSSTTPDKLKTEIVTPSGSISYDIQVMKSQEYALEEIFEKRLLFLIPFYIFSHEQRFKEYNQDEMKLGQLNAEN